MTLAEELGPRPFKAMREAMISEGLCRLSRNQQIGIVVRLFQDRIEHEMVPSAVDQALKAESGLRAGRLAAREGKIVRPASNSSVDAIRPFVTQQVWSMFERQRLTSMSSGEVTIMRTRDLDPSGDVWAYTPSPYKTEHHGRDRIIDLGPRAQQILRPWLREDAESYLFQPNEAIKQARAERHRKRATLLTPSQRARRPTDRPGRVPRERYNSQS